MNVERTNKTMTAEERYERFEDCGVIVQELDYEFIREAIDLDMSGLKELTKDEIPVEYAELIAKVKEEQKAIMIRFRELKKAADKLNGIGHKHLDKLEQECEEEETN